MTLVAEAAEGTLSDVAADENFIVEPDVVRAYVSAVAAVSASPEETTSGRRDGVEIVAGAPSEDGAADAARRPRRRRRRVGRRDDRRRRRGKSLRATERDVGRHGRRRVGASDDDRVARRRVVGQKAKKSSSSGGCESVLGRGQRDDVGERDASADADAVRAPRRACRRRSARGVRAGRHDGGRDRHHAGSIRERDRGYVREDGGGDAGVEAFPDGCRVTIARRDGTAPGVGDVRVSTLVRRVGGEQRHRARGRVRVSRGREVLPSATRMMTDGSAVDVRLDDGATIVDPEEEVVALVPFTGSGLIALEKVIYEYRCARHSGGVWVLDESVVRTAAVEETAPGEGRVTCAGKGGAMFGYLVGVVIAPIDFTLTENDRLTEETMNVYWYVMGGTAATAVLFGVQGLKRGMRRYTVKVANSDNAVTN